VGVSKTPDSSGGSKPQVSCALPGVAKNPQ